MTDPLVEALLLEPLLDGQMELLDKSRGAGGSIDGSTSECLDEARLGVRALCAEDPRERDGDDALYFDLRVFRSTSLGVVSPDLGRMEPTDVARD